MRDENYITPVPPEGFCRNRYCPSGRVTHEALVRGYCEPCASIRRPNSDYQPSERLRGNDWNSISMFDAQAERW
jgi:hypothetical protein